MKLGIVGSRSLHGNGWAAMWIRTTLDNYHIAGIEYVISGGAIGIDTMAADMARSRGLRVLTFWPLVSQWGGPLGFEARNRLIAEESDVVVAIVDRKSRTQGAMSTIRFARELGKRVTVIDGPVPDYR